jgi:hypothetical protein
MTDTENQLEGIGTALGNAQSLSILKDAQKRRQEREHTLFLAVPSWDGDLICEYRVVPPDELTRVAERAVQRARNNGKVQPASNDIAMIVAACVGLYVKHPETGERVPVEDEFGHVGYNRIAKVLGKEDEIKSNADAVRYLMAERDEEGGWTENIMAMSLHANSIGKWTRDPGRRGVDLEELLGEF